MFTDLFSETNYTFQLYCALHPEDTTTKREDLSIMTLESHLLNQLQNDLGFLVGDRLIILVEAQSTWSINIIIRALMYLVHTWYKYIQRMQFDVYGSETITLPKPEVYVIYTGPGGETKPKEISLKDYFFNGEDVAVDCTVKIIVDGKNGDIISQYVRFCHVFDEQVRIYGRTRKAVEETIHICLNENVLTEYLTRQREEVINIMLTLFDQETIIKNHDASVARKAKAEGRVEGRAEGQKEAKKETTALMAFLAKNGRTDDIVKASIDEGFLEKLLSEFKGVVLAK